MGMSGQRHALAALPPGKTRYPLYMRLGGPQGRSGEVRKMSHLTGNRSPDRAARSESLVFYFTGCTNFLRPAAPCQLADIPVSVRFILTHFGPPVIIYSETL